MYMPEGDFPLPQDDSSLCSFHSGYNRLASHPKLALPMLSKIFDVKAQ